MRAADGVNESRVTDCRMGMTLLHQCGDATWIAGATERCGGVTAKEFGERAIDGRGAPIRGTEYAGR